MKPVETGTFTVDEDEMSEKMMKNAEKIASNGIDMFIERMGTHREEFSNIVQGSHEFTWTHFEHKKSGLKVNPGSPLFRQVHFKNPYVRFSWKQGWAFHKAYKAWRKWDASREARATAREVKERMTQALEELT